MLFTAPRIAVTARRLRPRVCHLHDPELLFIAPVLRRGGTRSSTTPTEELAKQVLSKPWIPERLRRFVSAIVSHTLPVLLRWVDAIVAATPKIAEEHQWPRCRRRELPEEGRVCRRAARAFRDTGSAPRLRRRRRRLDPWCSRIDGRSSAIGCWLAGALHRGGPGGSVPLRSKPS